MAIFHKIKEIRETKKTKQQVLASVLGISQSAYADIENGVTKIKVDDLIKIAKTLETPLEDFLKEELSINNIQYNHDSPNSTNVVNNDFMQERKLWELLLQSKDELIKKLQEENEFLQQKST